MPVEDVVPVTRGRSQYETGDRPLVVEGDGPQRSRSACQTHSESQYADGPSAVDSSQYQPAEPAEVLPEGHT